MAPTSSPILRPRYVYYSDSSSLSTGAIAGIVIVSCLFFISTLALLIRRKQARERQAAAAVSMNSYYPNPQEAACPPGMQRYPLHSNVGGTTQAGGGGVGYGYRTADGQLAAPGAGVGANAGEQRKTDDIADVPPAYSPPGQDYNNGAGRERNDGVIR